MQSATLPSLFRISEQESIVFTETDLPTDHAYVALGHIHQPQMLSGLAHVRYCGSIERLDLGTGDDDRASVRRWWTLANKGGLKGEPQWLPLPVTPIYAIDIHDPQTELSQLREAHPDARRDLVYLHFTYTAGKDNLEGILRELEEIFPRWYARDWTDAGALGPALTIEEANRTRSIEDTVRDYLRDELMNHEEPLRNAVLERAEALFREVQS